MNRLEEERQRRLQSQPSDPLAAKRFGFIRSLGPENYRPNLSTRGSFEKITGFRPEGSRMPEAVTEADVGPWGGSGKAGPITKGARAVDEALRMEYQSPGQIYKFWKNQFFGGGKEKPEKPAEVAKPPPSRVPSAPPPQASATPKDTRKRALEMAGVNPYLEGDAAQRELIKRENLAEYARGKVERWKEANLLPGHAYGLIDEEGRPLKGATPMGRESDYLLPQPMQDAIRMAEDSVPIETLRATVGGHYDPRTKQEYPTLAEALLGKHSAMTEQERLAGELLLEMQKGQMKEKWHMDKGEINPITNEWIREPSWWKESDPNQRVSPSDLQQAEAQQQAGAEVQSLEKEIAAAAKKNNLRSVIRRLENTAKNDYATRAMIWRILDRLGLREDAIEVGRIMRKQKGKK